MKRKSGIIFVTVLIAVGMLLVVAVRHSANVPAPTVASTQSEPLVQMTISANHVQPSEIYAEPEGGPQVSAIESPWARQLQALRELARSNPDEAISQIADMSDKHERTTAAAVVCLDVAAADPAKAMAAAWALDLGHFSHETRENTALEELAQRWAEKDLVNALQWESKLPPDEEGRRDRIVKGIALVISQIEPAEAARLVIRQIDPESSVQQDAITSIVREWAAHDSAGATAWVGAFPPGALRDRAMAQLTHAHL